MEQRRAPGPYLKAALLCENVIEDKQGILSVIRIIDRVQRVASGTAAGTPPDQMEPFAYKLFAVLMFVSGGVPVGTQELGLVLEKPSGMREAMATATVLFEGAERGVNVIMQMQLQLEMEGLYWIDVHLGEQLVTRMPLRVVYQRLSQRLPAP